MKNLNDVEGVAGVPTRCERCGAPLSVLVKLFGPALAEFHTKMHEDEDKATAMERLYTLAVEVYKGAPPLVLGPALEAFKQAFKLNLLN
jgi:hypothetical protein